MIVYSKVTVAPATEPVTVSEVKTHLRLSSSFTSDDAYITTLIQAAREMAEAYSGLSFIAQTRVVKLDSLADEIELPYGPVNTVSEFQYYDSNNASQTLTLNTDFYLDSHSGIARITPINDWPALYDRKNAVSITYTAGYANAAAVPAVIKQALLMLCGSMYENRMDEIAGATISQFSWNAQALLDKVKVYGYAWKRE